MFSLILLVRSGECGRGSVSARPAAAAGEPGLGPGEPELLLNVDKYNVSKHWVLLLHC